MILYTTQFFMGASTPKSHVQADFRNSKVLKIEYQRERFKQNIKYAELFVWTCMGQTKGTCLIQGDPVNLCFI